MLENCNDLRSNRSKQRRAFLLAGAVSAALAGSASAATFTYTTANGASDSWAAGTNWSAAPVSAADTALIFNAFNGTVLPNSVTNTSTNDASNPFTLSTLSLQGTGPATGAGLLTISGSQLKFINNGATGPVINLNANNGAAALTYTLLTPINFANDALITGNGTASFIARGAFTGSGGLLKTGTSTFTLGADASAMTGNVSINGGSFVVRHAIGGKLRAGSEVTFFGTGGEFRYRSDSASGIAGSQSLGTVSVLSGNAAIRAGIGGTGGGATTLEIGTLTLSSGAAVNFAADGGTNGTNAIMRMAGQSGFLGAGYTFDSSFAWQTSGSGFIRGMVYNTDANTTAVSASFVTSNLSAASGKHVQLAISGTAAAAGNASGTSGASTITVTTPANFAVGSIVTGPGVQANTYVTAISGNVLTLSQNLTANNTSVASYGAISSQGSDSVASIRTTGNGGTILLQDNAVLTLSSGGFYREGNQSVNFIIAGGSGSGMTQGSNGDLFFHSNSINGDVLINVPILNTTNHIVKNGPGALVLNAENAYTGNTYLNAGEIVLGIAESGTTVSGVLGSSNGTIGFHGGTLQHTSVNTTDYSARFSTAAGQNFRIDPAGQTVTLASALQSAGGTLTAFTNNTGGTLVLLGTNTYDGGTFFTNNSNIRVGNGSAFGSGALNWNAGLNSLFATGTDTLTFSNAINWNTSSATNFGGTAVNFGNLVFTGPVALNGNMSMLAQSGNTGTDLTQWSAVVFEGDITEVGSGRTFTLSGSTSGNARGYVFLMGSNNYSGQTILTHAGETSKLVFNSINNVADGASALGDPTNATDGTIRVQPAAAGTIRYIGDGDSTDRVLSLFNTSTGGSAINVEAAGSGALTFSSDLVINAGAGTGRRNLALGGTSPDANTMAGAITNPAGGLLTALTKNGSGTWVLAGNNTFSGGLTINSGNLVLDYANHTPVASANTLSIGRQLTLRGKANTASSQTLGNMSVQGDSNAEIVFQPGTAGTMALIVGNLGNGSNKSLVIDHTLGGSMTATGTMAVNNGIVQNTIVRDNAGSGFATSVSGGGLAKFDTASATTLTAAYAGSTTANIFTSGDLTLTAASGNQFGNTLTVDTTGGGTLNLGGVTRNFGGGGRSILFNGSGDYNITNGTISPGNNEMSIFQESTGTVVIAANVQNGTGSFIKAGTGTLELQNRTSSGDLRVLDGALRVNGSSILSRKTIINTGGVLEMANGDLNVTLGISSGNIGFLGDGGFAAFGADRNVNLNSSAPIAWGSTANFVPNDNALVLGSTTASHTLNFQNDINTLNQQRVVRVNNGPATIEGRLSGVISGRYGGGLIKDGAGTLELTNANTYIGETWVRNGTLLVNNTAGSGTGSGKVTAFSGGSVGGGGTIAGQLALSGGSVNAGNGVGQLRVGSLATAAANSTLQVDVLVDEAVPGNSQADLLINAGNLNLASVLNVSFNVTAVNLSDTVNGVLGSSQSFILLSNLQNSQLPLLTNFNGLAGSGLAYSLSLVDGDAGSAANDLQVTFNQVPVPEPTSLSLLGLGAAALLRRRRRRTAVSA